MQRNKTWPFLEKLFRFFCSFLHGRPPQPYPTFALYIISNIPPIMHNFDTHKVKFFRWVLISSKYFFFLDILKLPRSHCFWDQFITTVPVAHCYIVTVPVATLQVATLLNLSAIATLLYCYFTTSLQCELLHWWMWVHSYFLRLPLYLLLRYYLQIATFSI